MSAQDSTHAGTERCPTCNLEAYLADVYGFVPEEAAA